MIKHNLFNFKKLHHIFFNSKGGVSPFPFNSLNCSYNTNDTNDNVFKNRLFVKKSVSLDDLFFINQIHSNKVLILENKTQLTMKYDVDGIVTKLKKIGISILTADCAPILFFDPDKHIIGACHAGWRGAIDGVIENTIKKMTKIGSSRKNIIAILGPTIQQNSYEVGNDLAIKIEETEEFKFNSHILEEKFKKLFFNLPLFIKDKLSANKIKSFGDVKIDTYTNKNFFSHRRTTQNRCASLLKNDSGRQVSVIGLK